MSFAYLWALIRRDGQRLLVEDESLRNSLENSLSSSLETVKRKSNLPTFRLINSIWICILDRNEMVLCTTEFPHLKTPAGHRTLGDDEGIPPEANHTSCYRGRLSKQTTSSWNQYSSSPELNFDLARPSLPRNEHCHLFTSNGNLRSVCLSRPSNSTGELMFIKQTVLSF